ncbi:MAG TPA: iron uptake porin, partial [Oculatellaceae cyanobacterium]
MYKKWWNLLLVNPAILGAAFVVSASAIATETSVATEAAKLQIVEAQNPVVRQDDSFVSTTATVAPIRTTDMEKPIVADVEAPVSVTTTERGSERATPLTPVVGDSAQLPTSVAVTPTAESSSVSAPGKVAEVPVNASDAGVLEQIDQYSNESEEDSVNSLDQVTNVTQLRDVSPNDWAFEALRSLVERYGCIAGYPDGTYRGNRAMSRYEFAAGLNACLQQVERIIRSSTEGFATKQDLAAIQRLVAEFGPELAVLRGRVDALEARTAELEATQFSTTTKLQAEAIFALAGIPSGDRVNGFDVNQNTVLGYRVRLNLDTSFTGEDLLRTRLQAVNLDAFSGSAAF